MFIRKENLNQENLKIYLGDFCILCFRTAVSA